MIYLAALWLLAALWGAWLGDAEHPRRVEARRRRELKVAMDRVLRMMERMSARISRALAPLAEFGVSVNELARALVAAEVAEEFRRQAGAGHDQGP